MTLPSNSENIYSHSESGLTLLEVLASLFIISLSFVIIAPNFKSSQQNISFERKAKKVTHALSNLRNHAIRKNEETVFFIDIEKRHYWSNLRENKFELNPDISIQIIAADTEYLDDRIGGIRFFPDGSSTAGTISIGDGNTEYKIVVDWLSGHTKIETRSHGDDE